MERQKKIVFRIIFLLGVFLCPGINGYSNCEIQQINTERSSDTKKEVKTPVSEVDFHDDEQINPGYEIRAVVEDNFQKPFFRHRYILSYSTSVWQPPKNN